MLSMDIGARISQMWSNMWSKFSLPEKSEHLKRKTHLFSLENRWVLVRATGFEPAASSSQS